MASSDCVELLTGLYQSLFFDILSILSMFTQNDQRIKLIYKAFLCIYINVLYILKTLIGS